MLVVSYMGKGFAVRNTEGEPARVPWQGVEELWGCSEGRGPSPGHAEQTEDRRWKTGRTL